MHLKIKLRGKNGEVYIYLKSVTDFGTGMISFCVRGLGRSLKKT